MTYISRFVTGMRAKVRYEVLGDNKESRETGDSLKNYQKEGRKFKCLQSDNKLASKRVVPSRGRGSEARYYRRTNKKRAIFWRLLKKLREWEERESVAYKMKN